ASIWQSGQIPVGARSIQFYAAGNIGLSFGGQQIPLSSLGSGNNYVVFGGDISAFAGQTGELRFVGNGLLDNISFSSQAIPEPGGAALLAVGLVAGGASAWRRRRR